MTEPVIANVADTAFLIAMQRALETARPDALFHDRFAAQLAGERGRAILDSLPKRPVSSWAVAIRTVVIDDLIGRAIAAGTDTVLSLGAGLDTRPYRMSLPAGLRWIEVDFESMIDRKTAQLGDAEARCRIERIKLDLADSAARRVLFGRLAREATRLIVLTEGVIPYLSVDEVGVLADDLRQMPCTEGWIVDYFSPQTLRYRRRFGRDFKHAPFKFEPNDWFGFFAEHGWQWREKRFLIDEGARLGRPVPAPIWLRVLHGLRALTSSPAQRQSMREFAGYFLMVPTRANA